MFEKGVRGEMSRVELFVFGFDDWGSLFVDYSFCCAQADNFDRGSVCLVFLGVRDASYGDMVLVALRATWRPRRRIRRVLVMVRVSWSSRDDRGHGGHDRRRQDSCCVRCSCRWNGLQWSTIIIETDLSMFYRDLV